jgi:hypothetical protein
MPRVGGVLAMALCGTLTLNAKRLEEPRLLSAHGSMLSLVQPAA